MLNSTLTTEPRSFVLTNNFEQRTAIIRNNKFPNWYYELKLDQIDTSTSTEIWQSLENLYVWRETTIQQSFAVAKLQKKIKNSVENLVTYFLKQQLDRIDPRIYRLAVRLGFEYKYAKKLPMAVYLYRLFQTDRYAFEDICRYNAARYIFARQPTRFTSCWRYDFWNVNKLTNIQNRILDTWPRKMVQHLYRSDWEVINSYIIANKIQHFNPNSHIEWYLKIKSLYNCNRFGNILSKTNDKEFRKAAKIVGRNLRSSKNIYDVVSFLADTPTNRYENVNSIVRLAQIANDYHREIYVAQYKQNEHRANDTTPVVKPSIDLPNRPEISFLARVSDFELERSRMYHCIHSYAEKAKRGECFCFHIEYEGEMATVEISPTGQILQSYGPRNIKNKASKWGQKVLTKWALPLRKQYAAY